MSRRPKARDRVSELIRVKAGELEANPSNWRRHPAHQRAALRALLREIGYADALLARRDGDRLVLVDGHLRKSLDPDQEVPVLVLDIDEQEADKLLATLDPIASLATADPGALADLLLRVRSDSRAVSDLLAGLRRSAGLLLRELLVDPDEAPPLPRRPRTRPGDLYTLGEHRLVCGDATSGRDLGALMGEEL